MVRQGPKKKKNYFFSSFGSFDLCEYPGQPTTWCPDECGYGGLSGPPLPSVSPWFLPGKWYMNKKLAQNLKKVKTPKKKKKKKKNLWESSVFLKSWSTRLGSFSFHASFFPPSFFLSSRCFSPKNEREGKTEYCWWTASKGGERGDAREALWERGRWGWHVYMGEGRVKKNKIIIHSTARVAPFLAWRGRDTE